MRRNIPNRARRFCACFCAAYTDVVQGCIIEVPKCAALPIQRDRVLQALRQGAVRCCVAGDAKVKQCHFVSTSLTVMLWAHLINSLDAYAPLCHINQTNDCDHLNQGM